MSFVTPDFKQEQAASRAQKPGGRGREGGGEAAAGAGTGRSVPGTPAGAEERVLPQLKTQRARQLPGERRCVEKGPPRARHRAEGAYLQGGARRLGPRRAECSGHELAAPWCVIAVGFFPFVKSSFSMERVSD